MTTTDLLETVFVIRGADALITATLRASAANATLATTQAAATAATVTQNLAQTALIAPLSAAAGLHFGVARSLVSAVSGFQALAAEQGAAAAATAVLNTAISALNPVLLLIVGTLAVLAGGFLIAKAGLDAFAKSESAIGRLAIELRDLGNKFPANELVAFSNHLQDLTGISHNAIERLGGLAASFGLTRSQIEKLIPTTLDISVGRNIDPEQVLRRLLQASGGRTQGLRALGINPALIKGDLHDINNLIAQVGAQFRGTAEAFRGTLPGTLTALESSVNRFFEAIGRFISPVAVPLLNLFISALDRATALMTAIANLFPGLFPTAADLGKGKANELALKGDPEQTSALQGIEKNTAALDPFIKHVLGGKGTEARRAATWRDARLAWGI